MEALCLPLALSSLLVFSSATCRKEKGKAEDLDDAHYIVIYPNVMLSCTAIRKRSGIMKFFTFYDPERNRVASVMIVMRLAQQIAN